MAYEVDWSTEALLDLTDTVSYLVDVLGSRQAGTSFKAKVNAAMKTVASRPLALPRVSDAYLARRGYRRAVAGDYLLLFRVIEERASIDNGEVKDRGEKDDGLVRVLRVFHVGRDYPSVIRHRP